MAKGYIERMLAEKEHIILIIRQHWFVLASAITLEAIVLLTILIVVIIAGITLASFLLFVIPIGVILMLIPVISMIHDILGWYNRQYMVTSRRVIQISGVINKNVIDSSLEKVNDVKLVQSFFGRIFGYGDVEILTASELGANLFRRIGDPVRFKTAMLNAKEQLERGPESNMAPRLPDIPEMIAQLDSLRQKGVLTEEEFQRKKSELLSKM